MNNCALLAKRTRYFVWVSYIGLLITFTISTMIWPSCNKHTNMVIWLIHLLPLLLFLPGLIKCNVRTHVWLSFISLGYFLAAVPAVYGCVSVLSVIETLFIVQLFIASMLYVRWRSRQLAASDPLPME